MVDALPLIHPTETSCHLRVLRARLFAFDLALITFVSFVPFVVTCF